MFLLLIALMISLLEGKLGSSCAYDVENLDHEKGGTAANILITTAETFTRAHVEVDLLLLLLHRLILKRKKDRTVSTSRPPPSDFYIKHLDPIGSNITLVQESRGIGGAPLCLLTLYIIIKPDEDRSSSSSSYKGFRVISRR